MATVYFEIQAYRRRRTAPCSDGLEQIRAARETIEGFAIHILKAELLPGPAVSPAGAFPARRSRPEPRAPAHYRCPVRSSHAAEGGGLYF